jgi:mannose-1-phosphate guanylyltransferase
VPFLAHQLARARVAGVRRVVFATSYRAEMFADCFGSGAEYGLELAYVTEREPLGTGGAIRNAASALHSGPDEPILILNGDILSGHDLAAQLALHEKTEAAVTLHLTEVDDPARFGCVPTDEAGRVTAFLEKTPRPVTNRINAGCYVFRRSVIDRIPAGQVVSVERETFPGLIDSGATVMGNVDAAYWLDVGTPEAFVRGSCDLVLGRLESPATPTTSTTLTLASPSPSPAGGRQVLALDGARIDPAAALSGGSVVGAGASVARGATVTGSVLFDGAAVGEDAEIKDSVLGHGARVEAGAVLDRAVLGDGAIVGPGNELRAGLRLWPGVELPATAVRFSSDL